MNKKLYKKTIIKDYMQGNGIIKNIYYNKQGLEIERGCSKYSDNKLIKGSFYKNFYKDDLLVKRKYYSITKGYMNFEIDLINKFEYDDKGLLVGYEYTDKIEEEDVIYDDIIDRPVCVGDKIKINRRSYLERDKIESYINNKLVKTVVYEKGKLIRVDDCKYQQYSKNFYENEKIKIKVVSTVFNEDDNCIEAYEYKYNENDELVAIIDLSNGERIKEFYYTNGELVNEKHYCNGKVIEDINYEYEYWDEIKLFLQKCRM